MTSFWRPNLQVNVEWLNKRGVKTQTALIPFGNYASFFVFLVGCLIVSFFTNFSVFIDQTRILYRVFTVDIVHNEGKNFAPLLRRDEYLCPLTVTTMWHGRRVIKQTRSTPAPQLPPKKNMFNVLSSWKLEFSATHWHFSVEWSNYSVWW